MPGGLFGAPASCCIDSTQSAHRQQQHDTGVVPSICITQNRDLVVVLLEEHTACAGYVTA